MNRKKITAIFYWCIIINQFFETITASQYAPNIFFSKPSKDVPNQSNFSIGFSAGFANKAFNANGETVPFLQQYGTEDFLNRFIEPSLGPDNLTSAGLGHISGKYHFKQFRFIYEQNIHHKLLFGAEVSLQDLAITNISPEFLASEYPLSENQINYLNKLEQVIPKDIFQSGVYTTILYAGYNERHTDFNHIDYFEALLVGCISTPQSMSETNHSILQFPCSANYFFGYPVVGAITVGVNDYFAFALSGLVVPFQPATMITPINKTNERNKLLFSQSTQAKIHQDPFYSGTIYIELTHPNSNCTGLIGYSYSEYLDSTINPINAQEFPRAHSSKSLLLNGYSVGALLLQLEIDCASDQKKLAPVISFFFSTPIAGNLFPLIYLWGSQCHFEINYEF